MRQKRLQAAMEYLMSYGWMILIIVAVIGALAYLGVFNPSSFAPRIENNTCQVYRPSGPGTLSNIKLVGTCGGALPEYTAKFNGQSSRISLPSGQTLLGTTPSSGTLALWADVSAYPANTAQYTNDEEVFLYVAETTGNGYPDGYNTIAIIIPHNNYNTFGFVLSGNWIGGQSSDGAAWGGVLSLNKWFFLTLTFTASGGQAYVNGNQVASLLSPGAITLDSYQSSIGNWRATSSNPVQYVSGSLADVQIYNAALSANEVQALYKEGIGGAPFNLRSLVGWWPLNGDVNDYSGNGNNGVPTSVTFTSQWTNGYTAPH